MNEEKQEVTEKLKIEMQSKVEELRKQAKEIAMKLPKVRRKKILPKSLKEKEFTELLKHLPDKPQYKETKIAFLLAYESGMRISEIKNLEEKDFDLSQGSVLVRQGKFSKDRVVPLPKTWKRYMFDYIPIKKSIRSLERHFKNSAKKAGLKPEYVFHSLRHSFATRLVEKGMPLNQIQLLMGHANISATNVYIQANPIDALNNYKDLF